MTDLELTKRAKTYIDKLANGINPLDGSVIPEGDTINDIRLSRCLFYVSNILRQVIDNGGSVAKTTRAKKEPFNISFDAIQQFTFPEELTTLSKIAEGINTLVDTSNMKKLTYKNIADWLESIQMLEYETLQSGRNTRRPTENGRNLGISTQECTGVNGVYTVVLYNREAQQFIIDNMDAIIDSIKK